MDLKGIEKDNIIEKSLKFTIKGPEEYIWTLREHIVMDNFIFNLYYFLIKAIIPRSIFSS
jgi:hypothetical protein